MSNAYSEQMPITPPDIEGPLGVEQHLDGPQGPLFIYDTFPQPIDFDKISAELTKVHDGKEIVFQLLKKVGVIVPLGNDPIEITEGEERNDPPESEILKKLKMAEDFYHEYFFDDFHHGRKGLDGDGILDLHVQTEDYDNKPFLGFFVRLTIREGDHEYVRDAERIARILVLDEVNSLNQ